MPRGQNFRAGAERDRHTALIRERSNRRMQGLPPEPEVELEGTVEVGPSKLEKLRATDAMRAVRAAHWERPVISPEGELVARELGPEYFLDWEDPEEVVAEEKPLYVGWRIVGTQFGPAFQEPGRLPSLIDESELPDSWFFGKDGDAYLVIDTKHVD